MISTTSLFFEKAKDFQDKRAAIETAYADGLSYIERYKGSDAYAEEKTRLENKRQAELVPLQEEFRNSCRIIFGSMTDAIGSRTIKAPSADALNVLSLLKMRRKVRDEELERAAQTMHDNPVALRLLDEIAEEHGLPNRHFESLCPEMSTQTALDILDGLKEGIGDFIETDLSYAARKVMEYRSTHYGIPVDTQITKRALFDDKLSCYKTFLPGMNAESLRKFSELVDGGEND